MTPARGRGKFLRDFGKDLARRGAFLIMDFPFMVDACPPADASS